MTHTPQSIWWAVWQGVCLRCPQCGEGRLFKGYLKPVTSCNACQESFAHIRADDGPAWLTIIVVGHVLAPFMLWVVPNSTWPDWVSLLVWPLLALVMTVALLPSMKGLFIAALWRARALDAQKAE
jgi:uncharacterized protein (DUF983 family)